MNHLERNPQRENQWHETLVSVEQYDFRQVSPTALIPAYARAECTDLPWARDVVDFLRARGQTLTGGMWGTREVKAYAAFFEARFKSVNYVIAKHGIRQVLELAAGLSTRGMDFAQKGIRYVETDLAESSEMKREIVTGVMGSIPPDLHLCTANVLDRDALLECCSVFSNEPVAITAEGLLRYLTFDEKSRLAANVRTILTRFGGFWVTTDIHLKQWRQRHQNIIERRQETERLGRDLDPNYFDDIEHARRFFESEGFEVEAIPMLEGIRERVISLPAASEDLLAELNERGTFVLRVRA